MVTMQKYLVTGGRGLIGHHLVRILERHNGEVRSYDDLSDYGLSELVVEYAGLYQKRAVGIMSPNIKANLTDATALEQAIQAFQPHTVVHLASPPRQNVILKHRELGEPVMHHALVNLLNICKKYQVKRLVYASSSLVYGDFDNGVLESATCNPHGEYATLKHRGELTVRDICGQNGVEYVVIRPCAVYGPLDISDRVVGKFFKKSLSDSPLTVKGEDEIVDFTYVTDAAYGIFLAATLPAAANQTYNISRGLGRTLKEAANLIKQITGSASHIELNPKDKNFPSRGSLSIVKAQRELGYQPVWEIEEGFVAYYKSLVAT